LPLLGVGLILSRPRRGGGPRQQWEQKQSLLETPLGPAGERWSAAAPRRRNVEDRSAAEASTVWN
jgi:hypothetical protein